MPLLVRSGKRRITLTEEGRRVYDHAHTILQRKNYGAKNRKNASGRFLNGKSGLKRELFHYYRLPEHDVV